MSDDPLADALLITPFHRAVYQILLEAGFTEGRESENGEVEGPPVSMASMLTMTLSAYPTEDQLLDVMTWGQGTSQQLEELRPIARKLLALHNSDGAPA